MKLVSRLPIVLLLIVESAVAQSDAPMDTASRDLLYGRQYLECSSYFSLSPEAARASNVSLATDRYAQLSKISESAAFVLLGEAQFRTEMNVLREAFVNELYSLSPSVAIEKWNQKCSRLISATLSTYAPRIEAYARGLKSATPPSTKASP